jgi:hypothetical protein
VIDLTPSTCYTVRYKQQSGNYQWYEWEMTAVYLCDSAMGEHMFSLRPKAGTGSIRIGDVLSAVPADRSRIALPTRVGKVAA